jgi:hypothetical protein
MTGFVCHKDKIGMGRSIAHLQQAHDDRDWGMTPMI